MNALDKFNEQFGQYQLDNRDGALSVFLAGFEAGTASSKDVPDSTKANQAAESWCIEYMNQLHITTLRQAFVEGYMSKCNE
jgi:hypothetical protein